MLTYIIIIFFALTDLSIGESSTSEYPLVIFNKARQQLLREDITQFLQSQSHSTSKDPSSIPSVMV